MKHLVASIVLALAVPCAAQQSLNAATYESWVDFLAPDEAESGWCSVPWRESFRAGVRDSQIDGKPSLLWAMNGHPMGCV